MDIPYTFPLDFPPARPAARPGARPPADRRRPAPTAGDRRRPPATGADRWRPPGRPPPTARTCPISDFCSNFAHFGYKTDFLRQFHNGSAWFCAEELKTHFFSNEKR